jgi:two-component system alkaline phosphatase synthesis response regulator PhoP
MNEQIFTVLVIEDDRQIRRVVQGYLEQAGLRVLAAADGEQGLLLAEHEKPPLIVLDLMLPGIDGWEITRRLRRHPDPALANTHILMLTARVEEADRVEGLQMGADDYMIKPFSPRELVARVQAAQRRLQRLPAAVAAQVLAGGGLRIDPVYRTVTLDGAGVHLTAVEFDLLLVLARHPQRPFTRDELLSAVEEGSAPRGSEADPAYERTVDAHIKNLRQKLGGAGRQSRFIETVHGVGYRFVF